MGELVWLDDPQLTRVRGFRASGVSCGLKKGPDLDLALVRADVPCSAAAVFTTNRVQAAPVIYDQELMRAEEQVQAVVINSGFANACTGRRGLIDVRRMVEQAGDVADVPARSVFVMSTGVIGQPLPMDRISAGIVEAARALSVSGGHDAARAIMTTDTRPKEAALQVKIGGVDVTIAGLCKGAGMIHPDLATMLALIVTDVTAERMVLQSALTAAVEKSFSAITVDGDTSTNDTVLLLGSGQAGNPIISDVQSADYGAFVKALTHIAIDLAQQIVRDGEGATKFITVRVTGATTFAQARRVAKSIANSSLVKTAIYGQDANWGRVVCAAGYSGEAIEPERLSMWMEGYGDSLHLVKDGTPFQVDEVRAAAILVGSDVALRLDLGLGASEATVWTCDLTHAYVDINAHYRT